MIRLLTLRGVPLLLRPTVILLEGSIIVEDPILILVLPLAMMALMVSSIPVHLDYFKSQATHPDRKRLAHSYVSGLTWICLLSLLILAPLLVLLPLKLSGTIVLSVCLVFITEKLADETSRALEFRKAFVKWFLVQSLRSGWMAIPIVLSLAGVSYETAFLLMSGFACALMFQLYLKVLGLRPRLSREGFGLIRDNLVFLAGSFLTASYQQLPRVVIAKMFPEQAHIYLALAQVTQGVNLVFNVRFQIPYRRIIAHKPLTFQRRLKPAMLWILAPSSVVALIYLVLPILIDVTSLPNGMLAALLVPAMVANALTFSILGSYLGYLQWFARKSHVLSLYLSCIVVAASSWVVFSTHVTNYITLLSIPVFVMITGFVWIVLIQIWFFPNKAKDV